MKTQVKKNLLRIILWIAVIMQMALIFSFSMENAAESADTSGGFIRKILETVSEDFRELNSISQHEIIESLSHFTRKAAHFSIYGFLGILCTSALLTYNLRQPAIMLASTLICGLYAVSDEIHQYFVPGRACMISDMLLDTAGAFCGTLITILIAKAIISAFKKRK